MRGLQPVVLTVHAGNYYGNYDAASVYCDDCDDYWSWDDHDDYNYDHDDAYSNVPSTTCDKHLHSNLPPRNINHDHDPNTDVWSE